jgi:hypothetical protein
VSLVTLAGLLATAVWLRFGVGALRWRRPRALRARARSARAPVRDAERPGQDSNLRLSP